MSPVRYPRNMARADVAAEQLRAGVGALVKRLRAEFATQTRSWTEQAVLRHLEDGGALTTADLARAENVTPQSMGTVVAQLEDEGLVARRADPQDARRRVLSLTRSGRRALAEDRAARQDWLARAIATRLTSGEQRRLLGALEILRKIASD